MPALKKTAARPVHRFTLIFEGRPEMTEDVAEALFLAGCDDGSPGMRGGVSYLAMDREADTLADAILSTLEDVRRAGLDLRVARVERDADVPQTAAEIARGLGISREAIRLYAVGKRGPGDFPAPVGRGTRDAPLYHPLEVGRWVARHGLGGKGNHLSSSVSAREDEDSRFCRAINAAIELNRSAPDPVERNRLLKTSAIQKFKAETSPRTNPPRISRKSRVSN